MHNPLFIDVRSVRLFHSGAFTTVILFIYLCFSRFEIRMKSRSTKVVGSKTNWVYCSATIRGQRVLLIQVATVAGWAKRLIDSNACAIKPNCDVY